MCLRFGRVANGGSAKGSLRTVAMLHQFVSAQGKGHQKVTSRFSGSLPLGSDRSLHLYYVIRTDRTTYDQTSIFFWKPIRGNMF